MEFIQLNEVSESGDFSVQMMHFGEMTQFCVVGGLDNKNPDKQVPSALCIVFKYKLVSLPLFFK